MTAAADVDDVAVDRCVHGSYPIPRLNPAERAEAVRRMTAAGVSIAGTAARLGISERHVAHLRAADKPPAPARGTTTPGRVPATKIIGSGQ